MLSKAPSEKMLQWLRRVLTILAEIHRAGLPPKGQHDRAKVNKTAGKSREVEGCFDPRSLVGSDPGLRNQ